MPAPAGDFVLLEDFRRDPEGAPLATPSGLIEIASETVAGFGYPDQPGYPSWQDPGEWLGSPLAARWPIHLLTPQPSRRLHSQMNASTVSRRGSPQGRERVHLNPRDAEMRKLEAGQTVRVFNERGACLADVGIDDGLLPGVATLATGAPFGLGADGVELHGNPNVLTRDLGTSRLGQGCSAQSCLVEIEAFDGPPPPVTGFEPPELIETGAE
jgi:biotin/methionine sulfoxide reductase